MRMCARSSWRCRRNDGDDDGRAVCDSRPGADGRRDEVRRFYSSYFIGRWPADTQLKPISRTVGQGRVIDEFILSFTHDVEMPAMLPGVAPTGRKVELPHVVVMGIEKARLSMSISTGIKARCSRRLACWIRPNCRWPGLNRRVSCWIQNCRRTSSFTAPSGRKRDRTCIPPRSHRHTKEPGSLPLSRRFDEHRQAAPMTMGVQDRRALAATLITISASSAQKTEDASHRAHFNDHFSRSR
jgi:hypothetical protein